MGFEPGLSLAALRRARIEAIGSWRSTRYVIRSVRDVVRHATPGSPFTSRATLSRPSENQPFRTDGLERSTARAARVMCAVTRRALPDARVRAPNRRRARLGQRPDGGQRVPLVGMDADRFVEPGQFEDRTLAFDLTASVGPALVLVAGSYPATSSVTVLDVRLLIWNMGSGSSGGSTASHQRAWRHLLGEQTVRRRTAAGDPRGPGLGARASEVRLLVPEVRDLNRQPRVMGMRRSQQVARVRRV